MTTIKQSNPTTRRKFLGGAAVVGVAWGAARINETLG